MVPPTGGGWGGGDASHHPAVCIEPTPGGYETIKPIRESQPTPAEPTPNEATDTHAETTTQKEKDQTAQPFGKSQP